MWPFIGWIVVCATAVVPTGRWPTAPLVLFPTEAACQAADRAADALLADALRGTGRTAPVDLQCWCAGVVQGR
jgi:cobalamin biosynthesis Mg chelatase CobN